MSEFRSCGNRINIFTMTKGLDGYSYCEDCIEQANLSWRDRQEDETRKWDEKRHALKLLEYPIIRCEKCGTDMVNGFLVESNIPSQLLTIGEGIYWSPAESGYLGKRIALKAQACPSCGYVELYIRRQKDLEKVKLSYTP